MWRQGEISSRSKTTQPYLCIRWYPWRSRGNSHLVNLSGSLAPGAKESGYCADYRQMLGTRRVVSTTTRVLIQVTWLIQLPRTNHPNKHGGKEKYLNVALIRNYCYWHYKQLILFFVLALLMEEFWLYPVLASSQVASSLFLLNNC